MTAEGRRFDVQKLRDLAGETTFRRGETYHRDGFVEILVIDGRRVLAQVSGTEDYRTELIGSGRGIGGECSCPAFADRGFCKHIVATALAANALSDDAEAQGAGVMSRIREHLKAKGVDALAEMVIGLAERDPSLLRRLEAAAVDANLDDEALGPRLRNAIDKVTRIRDFVDYGEAPAWADAVEAALEPLDELVAAGRAGLVLRLAEHAIDRIEEAVTRIDDSDGHCGGLLHRAREIHLAAADAARPEPVQLARQLFAREMRHAYGTFDGASEIYAEALGEAGLAEYRRLAEEAMADLSQPAGASEKPPSYARDLHRLVDILDGFAARDGDLDLRIALRTKDLSSPWRYLALAEFCLEQGRGDEALRRAEEGLWVFEDARPDERLIVFTAELLSKAGRSRDAEGLLLKALERAPSFDLYARLRDIGGEEASRRALGILQAQLARAPGVATSRWAAPADLLVRILTDEKAFESAWDTVRRHGVSAQVKAALARQSEVQHPKEALETYCERVEALAEAGGGQAYEEAAALVRRMAVLHAPEEHAAYVEGLKTRFKRRRNLMKLLH